MRRSTILLASLAVALVMAMGISPAFSYFTDQSEANGGLIIKVTPTTDIEEWYANSTKHVVISNAADATTSVYVRARVDTALTVDVSGTGWVDGGDGWWYYGTSTSELTALAPGETTTVTRDKDGHATDGLNVKITFPTVKSDSQPDGAVYGDNVNVLVTYQSTPVLYDEDGNAYADWGHTLDTETTSR